MKQDHIIQKVFVEINLNNKEKALSIKEEINSFLSIDVFPKIEQYINTLDYNLVDYTVQIPRLELNLEVKDSSLNSELKDKIAQLFKEELSEITRPIETSNQETESNTKAYLIENQEKAVQTFIYFLETGSMPWWNSERKRVNLLDPVVFDTLILTSNFSKSIIPVLSKENVQNRIINQLSNEQIVQLCLMVLKDKEPAINLEADVIHLLSKLNDTDRITIWRLVFNVLSEYVKPSNTNLREYVLQQISKTQQAGLSQVKNIPQIWKTAVKIFPFIKENEMLESIRKKSEDVSESPATLKEILDQKNIISQENIVHNNGQYVQNAGLILIHPFIKPLFEHCDLLDPKTQQLIDPELCAHLLHYIATGKVNAPEYEMIFEKFLCNIPMGQSINKHVKLSRKLKTQAKNVIESVQHNWNPMKKSSVALLQNEFFQRPGKLVVTDYDYTLTIERKAQDILLDKLGWGISLVKLPWQEKFIFVNW